MQTPDSTRQWMDMFIGLGRELYEAILSFAPSFVGALSLLLLGWLVGRFARRLTVKLLNWSRISELVNRGGLSESLQRAGLKGSFADLVGSFIYFVVFLLFISAASDVLGWSAVSDTLQSLMAYVPNLLAAVLILVLAVIISRPVQAFFETFLVGLDVPFHRGVARFVRGAILVAGAFVALRQIGIDTRFLDSNVYMVVAGAVLVVALPLALGARPVVANLMSGFYIRRLYSPGQQVCLGQRKAVVKTINEVSVVFDSEEGDIHVPHSQLITKGYQA